MPPSCARATSGSGLTGPFQAMCECKPVFCPAQYTGGSCSPANICTNVPHTACQPTGNGVGIQLPWPKSAVAAFADSGTANGDPASFVELVSGALFVASAIAQYERRPPALLLLLLGAAALAGVVFVGGLGTVPGWVWIAAAVAVLMRTLGSGGVDMLTNTAIVDAFV